MNDWIEHDGGDRPVSGYTLVEVKLRNGRIAEEIIPAYFWGNGELDSNWNHDIPCPADIVAYRVVK